MSEKKKISISDYNGLYARAEVGFETLLKDFGFDCTKGFNSLEIHRIYKKSANKIVDDILSDLDIEVEE